MFKAKLRKIGNSVGVLIPKKVIAHYKLGDEIGLEIITGEDKGLPRVITDPPIVSQRLVFNIEKGVDEWVNI